MNCIENCKMKCVFLLRREPFSAKQKPQSSPCLKKERRSALFLMPSHLGTTADIGLCLPWRRGRLATTAAIAAFVLGPLAVCIFTQRLVLPGLLLFLFLHLS